MPGDTDYQRFEIETLRDEVAELRKAVVLTCDTYSSNRSEKQRIKALRFVAAKSEGPFSLAAVDEELERVERRDRDEVERLRAALQQISEGTISASAGEFAAKVLRGGPRP